SKIVENDGDLFVLFTSNLDQRMLKQQLQILANELGARLGPGTQLEYALFRSLLLVKGKPAGMLKATKEGDPIHQSNAIAENAVLLKPDGRKVATNYLMSYDVFVQRTKDKKNLPRQVFYRLLDGPQGVSTCFASLSMRSSLAAEAVLSAAACTGG
ncbi:MAG: hypothetical protein ACLVJ6_15415, partial [Merdibacter sp.]